MEPYTIVGEVRRFSQRYTAFARARWDPTSAAYGKKRRSAEEMAAAGKSGYSAEDFALRAGAWAMADCYGQSRRPDPSAGHMASAEFQHAARYEPDDWRAFTERLKSAARFYGASLVGVARVNPLWVYACDHKEQPIHLPEGVDSAVVMAVSMDYELIRMSPSAAAEAATANGYSRMAFVTECVAHYLGALGIPLAIDAGLGEFGRNGLLITRPYGPRVRLCKVFTDARLIPDEPVSFGVRECCEACTKCAEACSAGAISRGKMTSVGPTPSNNPGVLKWYVNVDACLAFWRENGAGCANCIRSCPFNRPSG